MKNRMKKLVSYILILGLTLESTGPVFADSFVDEIYYENTDDGEIVEEITGDYTDEITDSGTEYESSDLQEYGIFDDNIDSDIIEEDLSGAVEESAELVEEPLFGAKAVTKTVSGDNADYGDIGNGLSAVLVSGNLIISGTGKMSDWSNATDVPWYEERRKIKSVELPEGITNIGEKAFIETKLESVKIPQSVKSINAGAFAWCSTISSIELPVSAKIKSSSFENTNIKEFIINPAPEDAAVVNYTSAEGANLPWNRAPEEANITLSEDIKDIGNNMFYHCKAIKSVSFNAIESIGEDAFNSCPNLEEIKIDDAEKTISIGRRAFWGCGSVKKLDIPISIIPGTDSFKNFCDYGIEINILKGTGTGTDYVPNSTGISYAYTPWYNANIIKANAISSIDDQITKIGDYTFAQCNKISAFPALGEEIEDIGRYAFSGCKKLINLTIPQKVTFISDGLFANCSVLTDFSVSENVVGLGEFSFKNCKEIDKFVLPEKLVSMNKNTFYGCDKLTELEYERTDIDEYKWYTLPTFDEPSFYDLASKLTTVEDSTRIYLKTKEETPSPTKDRYYIYFRYGDSLLSQTFVDVEDGEAAYISDPGIPSPPVDGVSFNGWYAEKEFTTPWDFSAPLANKETNIYSKWNCSHENTQMVTTLAPTCTEDGKADEVCTFPACQEVVNKDVVIPALGHVYFDCVIEEYEKNPGNFEITLEPTLTTEGKARPKCKRCRAASDPDNELIVPKLFSDEAIFKVSDTEYTVNIVKGTSVKIPEIKRTITDQKWKATFTKLRVASVAPKDGTIKGLAYGYTDLTVRKYTKYSKVEDEQEYTDYIIHIKVANPQFSQKRYYIKKGDVLDLDSIFINVGKGNTKLPKELKSSSDRIVACEEGRITGLKYGSSVISVYVLGKKCGSCKVYVDDPELKETNISILNGRNYSLKLKGTNSKVTWSSSDESVAKVTNIGRVIPVATGTAVITAHLEKFDTDLTCDVYVDKPILNPVSEILMLEDGVESSFYVTALSTNYAPKDWKSSAKYATVDQTGKVTGVAAGTAIISCDINGVKHKCTVRICDPVIVGASVIKRRKKATLTVKGVVKEAEIKWKSSDSSVAMVSSKGVVMGMSKGTAMITARVIVKNAAGEELSADVNKLIEIK